MMSGQIYSFGGVSPRIHAGAYVHPSACIIGDVYVGEGCFIAPMATLRGDNGSIRLDRNCNVQDGCVLHCSPGGVVLLRAFAQVGHGAVLHGCTLMENCMVGINSTILDEAVVGADSMIAAHSLVTKATRLDPGCLYAGAPARFVKMLALDAIASLREGACRYAELAARYGAGLQRLPPVSVALGTTRTRHREQESSEQIT